MYYTYLLCTNIFGSHMYVGSRGGIVGNDDNQYWDYDKPCLLLIKKNKMLYTSTKSTSFDDSFHRNSPHVNSLI